MENIACELLKVASNDFLVKEGILRSRSFSALYMEVFALEGDEGAANDVSKCNGEGT